MIPVFHNRLKSIFSVNEYLATSRGAQLTSSRDKRWSVDDNQCRNSLQNNYSILSNRFSIKIQRYVARCTTCNNELKMAVNVVMF